MFDVVDPVLDLAAAVEGHTVTASSVTATDPFVAAFSGAMGRKGPFLIEVVC